MKNLVYCQKNSSAKKHVKLIDSYVEAIKCNVLFTRFQLESDVIGMCYNIRCSICTMQGKTSDVDCELLRLLRAFSRKGQYVLSTDVLSTYLVFFK